MRVCGIELREGATYRFNSYPLTVLKVRARSAELRGPKGGHVGLDLDRSDVASLTWKRLHGARSEEVISCEVIARPNARRIATLGYEEELEAYVHNVGVTETLVKLAIIVAESDSDVVPEENFVAAAEDIERCAMRVRELISW